MAHLLLMSFLGPDQPNQFNRLMRVLDRHELLVLDVGQAVIHDQLTLGIVAQAPSIEAQALAMREMLLISQEIGLTVRFKPIEDAEHQRWVSEGGQRKYIVTVMARDLSAAKLAVATSVISKHGFNIVNLSRLSQREGLGGSGAMSCFEFEVKGGSDQAKALKMECLKLSSEHALDVAIQQDNIYRRNRRLVCFDMDSTLIEQEVIVELARAAGVYDQVHEITERAMRGELDFNESFAERVKLLKGLSTEVLDQIAESLTVTEGADRLIKTLSALGYRTAILSGGFTYFAEYLKDKLGIDEVHANILVTKDGKVTGEVQTPIVDGERKAYLLREIAKKQGISLEQVIAVGDGANDLPMLSLAGLGVAFRAKPLVQQSANQALSNNGLDGILYLLGIREEDQNRLIGAKGTGE
jgi:phosphoserine phosphatase